MVKSENGTVGTRQSYNRGASLWLNCRIEPLNRLYYSPDNPGGLLLQIKYLADSLAHVPPKRAMDGHKLVDYGIKTLKIGEISLTSSLNFWSRFVCNTMPATRKFHETDNVSSDRFPYFSYSTGTPLNQALLNGIASRSQTLCSNPALRRCKTVWILLTDKVY